MTKNEALSFLRSMKEHPIGNTHDGTIDSLNLMRALMDMADAILTLEDSRTARRHEPPIYRGNDMQD